MDKVIKRRPDIYIYILAAIFCSILFVFAPLTAHAQLVSGQTRYYIINATQGGGIHNCGYGPYTDKYVDIYGQGDIWVVESYKGGYSIRNTTSKQYYLCNWNSTDLSNRTVAGFYSSPSKLTLEPSGSYYYITDGNRYLARINDAGWDRAYWVYSKSQAHLWNFLPEHTHNSSGVEYARNNGSVHTVYTYCNGHGGDHSQNRRSYNEGHAFNGWTGWSDYGVSQQIQSNTCWKCGYVAYNYQPRPYIIYYNGNNGSISYTSNTINYGATLGTLPTGSRVGYIFNGFFTAPSEGSQVSSGTTVTGTATYYAHWTPRTDTKYTVRHYQMNVNGSGYTLTDTDNLQGTTDTSVTPATKSYTGFTAPPTQTVNINADGSRVVDYYYSRNKYTFTIGTDASHYSHGIDTSGTTANGSYYYGATITLKASPKAGYAWSKWSDGDANRSRTVTMPANNLTITPYATLITYTIKYNTYGGSVSGNPTSYNVETATITLKNPALSGRTFKGWSSWNNSTRKTTFTIPKGSTGNLVISANWESNSSNPIYVGESEIKSNRFTIKM